MLFFWDASSLVKRYIPEDGSDTVDALFAHVPSSNMASTPWGYAETYSILLRRHNRGGALDLTDFQEAVTSLQNDVLYNPDFTLSSITDEIVFASISTMSRHHLNATDAAILTLLLRMLPSPSPSDFVLVTADQRLIRAANAEGVKTLNPADLPAADVPAFLASL
jgi:predicted nucleic acid-binding protein